MDRKAGAVIKLEIKGRPSPWANQPHEGIWRECIASQARAALLTAHAKEVIPKRVEIEFRMLPGRRGDLDNLAKPVLDTLFRQSRKSLHPVACIFECDDCKLEELILRRTRVDTAQAEGATIIMDLSQE